MGIGSKIKKRNSRLKMIFLLLAVFTMAATVCLTVIFVLPGIKDPVSLLKFSRTWYVVLSFVLFALWTGAVVLLVMLESRVMKRKSKGMIALAGIINGAALLGLLLSLIFSASGFSGRVGTITISNAEELSFIRNYPSGEYVITQDIDMNGEEWKSIPKYKGSINGNGHCILNINIGKDGFIEENLGTISSLTLSGVRYMEFEPGKEFGTLVKINRGSVLSCGISSDDVNANPGMNVLVGCNYGICQKNTGICMDRCEEHTYHLVDSAPASLFKPGVNSYLCKVCGDTYISVAVYKQPIKLIASIVLLLVVAASFTLVAFSYKKRIAFSNEKRRLYYKKRKYKATAGLSVVALFMAFVVFSYQVVGMNAGKGETWIDRLLANEEQLEANPPEADERDDAIAFEEPGNYNDAEEDTLDVKYQEAEALLKAGNKPLAAMAFGALGDYLDARERSFALWNEIAMRETISVGNDHIIGLKSDGTVVAAGKNSHGECDVESWTDIIGISTSAYYTVGLKSDGTVVLTGDGQYNMDVESWTDIVAVSCANSDIVGLKSDGTVAAVGYNYQYSAKSTIDGWTDIVQVFVASGYYTGLRSDGTVVGTKFQDTTNQWTDVVELSACDMHIEGLKSDGTIATAGWSYSGELNVGEWENIVAFASGNNHTVGLKSDGSLVVTGNYDLLKPVESWTDIVAVYAGVCHIVGLKADGTAVVAEAFGNEIDISGWSGIKIPGI